MKPSFYPSRISLARGIIADLLLPAHQTGKIALIAGGLPSSPVKNDLLRFLVERGYTACFFRYRGSWESKGYFLENSPATDIHDIITELAEKKSVTDIASGKKISLKVVTFHLFGGSFGGPAVLLNAKHPLVKKVIALSPVLDWKSVEQGSEPLHAHARFLEQGYPGAYRVRSSKDWMKLLRPDFYNPMTMTDTIDGTKVFILHAKDDEVVPVDPLLSFVKATSARYYLKPHGGHHLHMTHQFLWKKIDKFLRSH
jgi:pimeloyl-ACP methyl ester carboxylesterase